MHVHEWSEWVVTSDSGAFDPPVAMRECPICNWREVKDVDDPEIVLFQYRQLTRKVVMGDHPLLPEPTWNQDVAFLGFFIDSLRRRLGELESSRSDHDHCDHDPIECSYEAMKGEYSELREQNKLMKEFIKEVEKFLPSFKRS